MKATIRILAGLFILSKFLWLCNAVALSASEQFRRESRYFCSSPATVFDLVALGYKTFDAADGPKTSCIKDEQEVRLIGLVKSFTFDDGHRYEVFVLKYQTRDGMILYSFATVAGLSRKA